MEVIEIMSRNLKYKFNPDWVVPPGATIAEVLETNFIPYKKFAAAVDMTLEEVNDLFHGHLPVTIKIAHTLEELTGIPSAFWFNLEKNYQEGLKVGRKKVDVYGELM